MADEYKPMEMMAITIGYGVMMIFVLRYLIYQIQTLHLIFPICGYINCHTWSSNQYATQEEKLWMHVAVTVGALVPWVGRASSW